MVKKTNEKQITTSLKMYVMHCFRKIIESLIKTSEDYVSTSALILTANGLILGDLKEKSKKPIDEEKRKIEISYLSELLNEYIENIEKEHKIINYLDSGSMINIENVVLFPGLDFRKRINFNNLMVFVDQIISFTIVERKKFEEELSQQKS